MKLFYQYMTIFFIFPPTSSHLYPLQVENCGSNSRLVVDEDDNGKFGFERVKIQKIGTSGQKCGIAKRHFVVSRVNNETLFMQFHS